MRKTLLVCIAMASFGSGAVQADVFNLGSGLTSLQTVAVGDRGNAPDERCGRGAVGYDFRMGQFEVTQAQYCDFLNRKAKTDPYGLYSGSAIRQLGSPGAYGYVVTPGWENRPAQFVSFWDACRFANWIHNGQGDGDTETGAYTLNGCTGGDHGAIRRNPGARWFVPNMDEWHKAAYYKRGGVNAGYWTYPTQSDSRPGNVVGSPDSGNNANYWTNHWCAGEPYYVTKVGEFENSGSAYGTFDQGGNVWEWTDTFVSEFNSLRAMLGGAFDSTEENMHATHGYAGVPIHEFDVYGFRVASVPEGWQPVPEPSSLVALASGIAIIGMVWSRRRL